MNPLIAAYGYFSEVQAGTVASALVELAWAIAPLRDIATMRAPQRRDCS